MDELQLLGSDLAVKTNEDCLELHLVGLLNTLNALDFCDSSSTERKLSVAGLPILGDITYV